MADKSVRRAQELPVLQWLRVGAVAAGVVAAGIAGQGIAVADTGTGTETGTESQEPPANPDPEPAAEAEPDPQPEPEPEAEPAAEPTHITASAPTSSAAAATTTTAAVTSAAPALPPVVTIEISKASPSPPSLARPIRKVVLGVLGLFGFNPNSGSTNNPLLEALWGTYRRIESFIGNQPATAKTATITSSEVIDDTVTITGTIDFDDPNNDPLRYTATQGTHGTVVINALPFNLQLNVTFSPDGTVAYVAYRGAGAVSVIATGLAPYTPLVAV